MTLDISLSISELETILEQAPDFLKDDVSDVIKSMQEGGTPSLQVVSKVLVWVLTSHRQYRLLHVKRRQAAESIQRQTQKDSVGTRIKKIKGRKMRHVVPPSSFVREEEPTTREQEIREILGIPASESVVGTDMNGKRVIMVRGKRD